MLKRPQERQRVAAEAPRVKQTTGLTLQLQNTTDSVMKMKLQLENEIKLRDAKISEFQNSIKQMTKNLITLQQHSESLSHKLQYELLKRGNISIKIDSTRSICNALQEHSGFLSETLKKCNEEKDLLKSVQFQYLTELESLVAKTKECTTAFNQISKQRENLLAKYNLEKQAKQNLQDEVSGLKQGLTQIMMEAKEVVFAAKSGREKLNAQISVKDATIDSLKELNKQLSSQFSQALESSKEQQIHYEVEKGRLASTIAEKSELLAQKSTELEILKTDLEHMQTKICEFEEKRMSLTAKNESMALEMISLSSQLSVIKQELEVRSKDCSELLAKKANLEEKVAGIAEFEAEIEQLKSELQKACEETGTLLKKCEDGEAKCAELEALVAEGQNLIAQNQIKLEETAFEAGLLEERNGNLQNELNNARDEIKLSRESVDELKEKLNCERKEKKDLQNTLEILRSSCALESGEMASRVSQLSSSLANTKEELVLKEEEINSLIQKVSTLKFALDETTEQLSNERKMAENKTGTLGGEIEEKVKEIASLQSTCQELQANAEHLQEDNLNLQSQLKEATSEKDSLVGERRELEKELKAVKSEKNSVENKMKRLETKNSSLEKEKKELKAKMTKARSESVEESEKKDQAISDFEESIKEKDEHAAELEQALNDLKAANEEELKAREKKLSDAVAENAKLADKIEQMNKQKAEMEAKVAKLSSQLADTINNLNETSSKYESQKLKMTEKIRVSELKITSKEAEIARLSQSSQISNLMSSKKPILEEKKSLKSIMKSSEKATKLVTFKDNVSFISFDGDDDPKGGDLAPSTPTKTRTLNVPTTPRRSQVMRSPKSTTPQKPTLLSDDDEDELSHEVTDIGKSAKQDLNEMRSNSTPTKRIAMTSTDAPMKYKKARN